MILFLPAIRRYRSCPFALLLAETAHDIVWQTWPLAGRSNLVLLTGQTCGRDSTPVGIGLAITRKQVCFDDGACDAGCSPCALLIDVGAPKLIPQSHSRGNASYDDDDMSSIPRYDSQRRGSDLAVFPKTLIASQCSDFKFHRTESHVSTSDCPCSFQTTCTVSLPKDHPSSYVCFVHDLRGAICK